MNNMDFQRIIKTVFQKKKLENFEERVKKEKKQKYLFPREEESSWNFERNKKWGLFQKNKKFQWNNYIHIFRKPLTTISEDGRIQKVIWGLWIFLIFLVSYIIFFSPYFSISPNKVVIQSLNDWVDTNLVHRTLDSIYGKSIFFFDEKNLALKIKDTLKNTESVRIERLFPNGIKILIKSLPIQFDTTIFWIENKRFAISSNWVIIPLSDVKDQNFQKHLNIISQELESELFLNYKKVLGDKTLYIITKIFDIFSAEWPDIHIKIAHFFIVENELHIVTDKNTKIILSLQNEFETANKEFSKTLLGELLSLKTYIMKNKEWITNGSIQYIDARIPWKLFVCNDANICNNNLSEVYGTIYKK